MYEDLGDTFRLTCELDGCGATVEAPAIPGRKFPGVPGWLSTSLPDIGDDLSPDPRKTYFGVPERRYDFCPSCTPKLIEKYRELKESPDGPQGDT